MVEWGPEEVAEAVWYAATVRPGSTTEFQAATAAAGSSSAPCDDTCSTSARPTEDASSTPLDATSVRRVASASVSAST